MLICFSLEGLVIEGHGTIFSQTAIAFLSSSVLVFLFSICSFKIALEDADGLANVDGTLVVVGNLRFSPRTFCNSAPNETEGNEFLYEYFELADVLINIDEDLEGE